jgi:hypothetical protein
MFTVSALHCQVVQYGGEQFQAVRWRVGWHRWILSGVDGGVHV